MRSSSFYAAAFSVEQPDLLSGGVARCLDFDDCIHVLGPHPVSVAPAFPGTWKDALESLLCSVFLTLPYIDAVLPCLSEMM